MTQETTILLTTAASIGFFHTLLGPDHYLPFIALSKARGWSVAGTAWITLLCGAGHVAGSVLLGVIGVVFGLGLGQVTALESTRADWAAWALIAFGLVYFAWGVKRAIRNRPHSHTHFHGEGLEHEHIHVHSGQHTHVHERSVKVGSTPWVLFVIFLFGPCEPLIPILMYPAARSSWAEMGLVAAIFGLITVVTMLTVVLLGGSGVRFLPLRALERYSHPIAGLIILASGAGIKFLGL